MTDVKEIKESVTKKSYMGIGDLLALCDCVAELQEWRESLMNKALSVVPANYQCAVEWRDKCKEAEAERDRWKEATYKQDTELATLKQHLAAHDRAHGEQEREIERLKTLLGLPTENEVRQKEELADLHNVVGKCWKALGIGQYTGQAIWEHIENLVAAKNDSWIRLVNRDTEQAKEIMELKKVRDELLSHLGRHDNEVAHMNYTIKKQRAELLALKGIGVGR